MKISFTNIPSSDSLEVSLCLDFFFFFLLLLKLFFDFFCSSKYLSDRFVAENDKLHFICC